MKYRSESDKVTVTIKGSGRSIKVDVAAEDRIIVQCIHAMPKIERGPLLCWGIYFR
jgi:hypothetical protein